MLLLIVPALFLAGYGGATSSPAPAGPGSEPSGTGEIQSLPEEAHSAEPDSDQQAESTPIPLLPVAVTKVVDGDTVYVRLESGRTEKVRFIGVNTPEIHHPAIGEEPYAREASAFIAKNLSGRKVWLELDAQKRDKYGRLLTYVWIEPPRSASEAEVRAKMFNARLLLDGYAQVMPIPPNVKYSDMFVKFQQEAREQRKGLWGLTPAAPSAGRSEEVKYIGNARSKVFHRPDCEWAQKTALHNRVEFSSREEAIKSGYRPCKVCRP